jgi:murein DD-endopeptidase MepM/ murein hydrolase activator NlpD
MKLARLMLCGMLVLIVFVTRSKTVLAEPEIIDVIDTSGAWRLPFDGVKTITCAPGEGYYPAAAGECDHVSQYKGQEAIDYGGGRFPILAPANGAVLDVLTPTNGGGPYGYLLRISHSNGMVSFFGHLEGDDPNYPILVRAGDNVKQGELVAYSGKSGNASGKHLHFEARTGAVAGNRNSGNPSPIRSIPGNWFNTWYSPIPNLTWDDAMPSGGAQYPELSTRPSTTSAGARHLSNQQSPPNVPAGWTSNFTSSQIALHFGGAPSTPNTNWATTFNAYELRQNCNCWVQIMNTTLASPIAIIGSFNQSLPNGQHTFQVEDYNVQVGYSNNQRYYEALPENTASQIPHLVATYRPDTDSTTLEFCIANAGKYKIFEDHGAGSTVTYRGPGCTILVHRQLGSINRYAVSARIGGVWQPQSQWLTVQY